MEIVRNKNDESAITRSICRESTNPTDPVISATPNSLMLNYSMNSGRALYLGDTVIEK